MAEDKRNFIERSQSMAEKLHGREVTAEEMATEFSKHGLKRRAEILDQIDAERASDDEPLTISKAARRIIDDRRYGSKLRDVHEALRRAGR